MFKIKVDKLVQEYNLWRLIQIVLIVGIVISASALILELVVPVRLESETFGNFPAIETAAANSLSEVLQSQAIKHPAVAEITWTGLFKLDTSISDKPMADKTIEMIKSQLRLQCILELNGEPVAYVHIKDKGLYKCKVGDTVDDLFKVVGIN
jgi:hypothetical protein